MPILGADDIVLSGMINTIKSQISKLNPFEQPPKPRRERLLKTFKAKSDAKRKPAEKFADWATSKFGSIGFLFLNLSWFAFWILANRGMVPGVRVFDPFPFNLLTMTVSLEAIVLAVLVLISQNRSTKIDELREEVEFQVNIISEREITKVIKMLNLLLEKNKIDLSGDPELQKMLKPISSAEIEQKLEKEIFNP